MGLIFGYLRDNLHFNKSQVDHRRGNFPAVSVGISFGGGQQVCTRYFQKRGFVQVPVEASWQSRPYST